MGLKVKHSLLSSVYQTIGVFVFKEASFDRTKPINIFWSTHGLSFMMYPFFIFALVFMMAFNTISVKHNMLSFRSNGAFIGSTMTFVFNYILGAFGDYLLSGKIMKVNRIIGAVIMIIGVIIVSTDHEILPDLYDEKGEDILGTGLPPQELMAELAEDTQGDSTLNADAANNTNTSTAEITITREYRIPTSGEITDREQVITRIEEIIAKAQNPSSFNPDTKTASNHYQQSKESISMKSMPRTTESTTEDDDAIEF